MNIQYDPIMTTDELDYSSAHGLCDSDPEHVKTPEAE